MSSLTTAYENVSATNARIVFPEWDSPRIVEARKQLIDRQLATPVPLADPSDAQVEVLMSGRGIKEGLARKMLGRPMIRAAAMVACGEADLLVAGVETTSRRVIEAAGLAIGLADGVVAPSSFFLMVFPDGREFVFADCAVSVAPTVDELEAIARATERSGRALFGEARVALLSFSTGKSGIGDSVDLVREVSQRTGFPGPIQADAALNPVVADHKGLGQGNANVLVFPSLDAGNIAYKLCTELASAQAVGPILQGFRKPVCDLSRSAKPDEIVAASVVALALRQS